ncbi:unnamed protein product [Heterobilharzia americana]|nr:unnamed protein product [Heterobilharzia americana]
MIKVPGFTVSQLLGRGTYGHVYLGKKYGSCKLVAIKCMMKSKLGKQAQDNLVGEISILKTLEHPHIVCMLDFTWDASYVYIIMEYCGGGDLSRFLKQKRRLDELLVQHFLQQLALALQYLKSKNIVHMDLKPQNILLTSFNNPSLKLADFGFAQCIEGTARKNEVRGTLLYMAPEIYCEGVIIHPVIYGPLVSFYTNVYSLKEKLVKDEPIELPSTNEISKPCAALILGLLKRKPSERLNHEQFFSHPFIDLGHVPSAQSMDKATEFLERAPRLESLGNLCEAYDCYLEGLNHLVAACNYEHSRFRKAEIRSLMRYYLVKAESLKSELCLITQMNMTCPSSFSSTTHQTQCRSVENNLPDPIVPVKCYDVDQQPKKKNAHLKKNLCSSKTDVKSSCQSQTKSIELPTPHQLQSTTTNDEVNHFHEEHISHWLSWHKNERSDESNRKTNPVPTAVLVDVNPVHSSQLASEVNDSVPLPHSSSSPPQNSSSSGSDTLVVQRTNESVFSNRSVNSSTIEPTVRPNEQVGCSNPSEPEILQSESGLEVNSMEIPDDIIQKFDRTRLLELDGCNKYVVDFLVKFYKLISRRCYTNALLHFENEFSSCLKAVQNDSNAKNRNILLEQLKFAMNEAEKLKASLPDGDEIISNDMASEFQVGEEVFDENQAQDRCTSM